MSDDPTKFEMLLELQLVWRLWVKELWELNVTDMIFISFYGTQIVTPFLTYEWAECSVTQLIFIVNMLLSM